MDQYLWKIMVVKKGDKQMDFPTELRGVAQYTYPATHGLLMCQAADKIEELEGQLRDALYQNKLLIEKLEELQKTANKLHEQKIDLAKKLYARKKDPSEYVSQWAIENGYV